LLLLAPFVTSSLMPSSFITWLLLLPLLLITSFNLRLLFNLLTVVLTISSEVVMKSEVRATAARSKSSVASSTSLGLLIKGKVNLMSVFTTA
jgi:hypothetical protein